MLTCTTTLGQSGPGSNDKEGLLLILQSSRTGFSPADTIYCHTQETGGGLTPLKRCTQHILLSQPQGSHLIVVFNNGIFRYTLWQQEQTVWNHCHELCLCHKTEKKLGIKMHRYKFLRPATLAADCQIFHFCRELVTDAITEGNKIRVWWERIG